MSPNVQTTVCVAGGGPAGIFLGYLLARSGVKVIVVEKHADFLRDFRGDTIHPSTLELLYELDLLEEFLPIVDFRAEQLKVNFEGQSVDGPTFAHLPTHCKFIGFVPQWDLLNLLSEKAREFPAFELRMNTKATDLIRENGKVVGVRCEGDQGEYEIRADLVVGADGRGSQLREATDRKPVEKGVPIDVLWFRLDRPENDDGHTLGWFRQNHMLVTIPRRTHYQVAMIIRKGAFPQIQEAGIQAFRDSVAATCPPLAASAQELGGWDEVKLLTVQINHLENWCDEGLLFIGDAAHAMSPMGGVGINLAVQDAVATANLLVEPLRKGTLALRDLQAVQARRSPPARRMQWVQVRMHAMIFDNSASPDKTFSLPWYARTFAWLFAPWLRRKAGKVVGMGFQPEHIQTQPHQG
ncbi:FAD-dependent oxidoreductase [Lignipirellula cremea]|uniref:3-hydroxybenzoate 6-hydroxylase 1 n=1 Tax=Lignipirellula cremea TaxID=2528010 RepID=A0A518DT91_9BACT|nr:FAD-dependent oxidoreductase [Lignipirellula cremea]QDU95062.1 3-hydroxybenzoate 6-hydroxylase 1 [Lignipirellula cremea]